MRLSLGIFAHDEENNVRDTITSLFAQTLLKTPTLGNLDIGSVEILCLANGCSDQTVQVARGFRWAGSPSISFDVVELADAGKSRTWNQFVHKLSDPSAQFLILMDADIVFEQDDVLEQLLRQLLVDDHADVATDTPVKSFTREQGKLSFADRGSLAASEQTSKVGVLCGQLYCARADVLRRIWLPPELPVEDGYLAAMITTNGFTSPTDLRRIAWVPTARHFFRTHRSLHGFISHEARIIVGSTINSWIFSLLWEAGRDGHAGLFVASRNTADAAWVSRLVEQKVRAGGPWLVPMHFVLWRLAPLRGQPLSRKLRRAPIALAATALNFLACVRANAILKRQNAATHW